MGWRIPLRSASGGRRIPPDGASIQSGRQPWQPTRASTVSSRAAISTAWFAHHPLEKEEDILADIKLRPPQGRSGRQGPGDRPRHIDQPALRSTAAHLVSTTATAKRSVTQRPDVKNHIIDPAALSAARVVYDSYSGPRGASPVPAAMMEAVDKADSAQFTDGRSAEPAGLGVAELPDGRAHRPRPLPRLPHLQLRPDDGADRRLQEPRDRQILALPDVRERVDLYREQEPKFRPRRCATVQGKLVVLDLRDEETIYAGNRFMIYAPATPRRNISIHVMPGGSSTRTRCLRWASRSSTARRKTDIG